MINYPKELDSENLYTVHDSLRLKLLNDYNPGDQFIQFYGDKEIIDRFPDSGIITLTEQCSDPKERAISFYYASKTDISFNKLTLIGEIDSFKAKDITNITQNVMAEHHNVIKDTIIEIEKFAGKKNEISSGPLEGTMEKRINYLRKLALTPKAWFSANKQVGLIPLIITFKELSFRTATDNENNIVIYTWDFGDGTDPLVVTNEENISNEGIIEKTFINPGIYDIKLTVSNMFGEDTVIFPEYINARIECPQTAVINFNSRTGQIITDGTPEDGPYITNPLIRSPINLLIDIEIPQAVNPNTIGSNEVRSYAGELLNNLNSAIDPITNYTWSLADDLIHNNSYYTKASYSIGGIYDLILRVDTLNGSYKITTYENSIDIVEKYNLWLWTKDNNTANVKEFGLISETFKTKNTNLLTLNTNQSFLENQLNSTQQIKEFNKNVGFAQRGTTPSGNSGVGLLHWAGGRNENESYNLEKILFSEFNGFLDTYSSKPSIDRPWNWVNLNNNSDLYFIFGSSNSSSNTSPTNQIKSKLNLSNLSVSNTTFQTNNYKNGADELQENEVNFNSNGVSLQGNMSVYRSAWKDDAGYFLRNQGVGNFFRIKSFYKTSGTTSEPFLDIRKLPDLVGPAKTEGELLSLSKGVYFFNNSGSISAYNPTSGIWETGGTGSNSVSFRLLQDNSVIDFDNNYNTLFGASDGSKLAYLSYNYSNKAFIKFNELDLTFSSLSIRPIGNQWNMAIF